MKKHHLSALVVITLLFIAFTAGFFLGRNFNHAPVQLTSLFSQAKPAAQTTGEISGGHTETSPADTQSPDTAVQVIHPGESSSKEPQEQTGLINLNTATHAELVSLPGIGDVIAQRIIDYRETYGPFTSVTQLTNVEGIGTKRLESILDFVTVGGEQ